MRKAVNTLKFRNKHTGRVYCTLFVYNDGSQELVYSEE